MKKSKKAKYDDMMEPVFSAYEAYFIDLEQGTIHETVNENSESLMFYPYG